MDSGIVVSGPAPLLRLTDVAAYLKLAPATLYSVSWRRRHHIPAPIRVGGRPRWRLEDLERFIREQGAA